MAGPRLGRGDDAARFSTRLGPQRTLALALVPILLVGSVVVARAALAQSATPNLIVLSGGAERATPAVLTSTAADLLTDALATGAGIEFEIVQTSTITARPGGPLVAIPDPSDRTKTLGEADRYVMGTLVERGFATPEGYWMELLHGPDPGTEAGFDVAKAHVSRQALVRGGVSWRNDGEGWHETTRLPGIGLDPATIAALPALLGKAAAAPDAALRQPEPIDPEAARDAPLGPETVAVSADAVAASIDGLRGPAAPTVRALAAETVAIDLPGVIAIDLVAATELRGPAELRFDAGGRLVGLRVLARNTNLEVHDLLVETVMTLRYPDQRPELPRPEPAYVAPSPDPDGAMEAGS